jgi:hypothetical protein
MNIHYQQNLKHYSLNTELRIYYTPTQPARLVIHQGKYAHNQWHKLGPNKPGVTGFPRHTKY